MPQLTEESIFDDLALIDELTGVYKQDNIDSYIQDKMHLFTDKDHGQ